MLRVAFVASHHDVSWATEHHLARELELLGHLVDPIHEHTPLAEIEATARLCDVVVYMKATGLPSDATEMWRRLETAGVPSASIHLDLDWGLARGREIGVDPMWHTTRVFTADGDPAFAAHCATLGIAHRWMAPAVASFEAVPGTRREELVCDVAFTGHTQRYHREWPWRMTLLAFLRKRYGDRFRTFDHSSGMRDLRLNDLMQSATVMVGDSLVLPGHERYVSDRLVESVGRQGFTVFPRVPGIEEAMGFVDYQHARFYDIGDTDQLGKMIDFYIDHPGKAREIAVRGQAFVRARHTYRDRMVAVLDDLGLGE